MLVGIIIVGATEGAFVSFKAARFALACLVFSKLVSRDLRLDLVNIDGCNSNVERARKEVNEKPP